MPQEKIQVLAIEVDGNDAQLIQEMLDKATASGHDLPHFEVIHVTGWAAGLACLDGARPDGVRPDGVRPDGVRPDGVRPDGVRQVGGGIDVVLLHLDLLGGQAGETFARLRAHTPHLPIVVLTAKENWQLARDVVRSGAEDCLFKHEMDGSRLAHALLCAIERQRARAALQKARDILEQRLQERTAELESANAQLRKELAERKQVEQTLQESEEKYRSLFNQSVWGIYLHDLDGRILDVNQTACLQSGYSRDELLQLTVFDLHPDEADSANLPRDEILRQWSQWQPEQRSIIQGEHQRKGGTIVPVEVSTGVVRYGHRNLLLALVQDITERKRAADERDKLQAQLAQAQKMEAVGRLAGGVAHDFNNMLGVIIGHAELATRQIDPSHPLYLDLAEIHQAARRSADLTRQLLAFARKQIITPRVLDLNDAVATMLKMLRRLIGEEIDLIWLPDAELWPVKIDPGQFNQILINLCLNARDAIGGAELPGAGTITVEAQNVICDESYSVDRTEFVPGEYVQLSVSDDGCGMEEEVLENLFEPYFTTKVEGQSGGLGLATVYGAVKMNQGFIHVYSEPGQGTTFKIYLPRSTGQAMAIKVPRPDVQGGRETVLLVEDEPAVLHLARTMLGHLGYVVLSASRPGEALRQAAEYAGTIDLLVTDVVMPEMNGQELAAQIQADYPGLKCLYMSGYTANVIANRGVLEEGVWFLNKPFSIDELAVKVREVLDDGPGRRPDTLTNEPSGDRIQP